LAQTPNFDPIHASTLIAAETLPLIASNRLTPDVLRQRFRESPAWTPEIVLEKLWLKKPLTRASVLIALVMRDELMVLLTQRSEKLKNHSGQIAFAGGKVDESDSDVIATALREAREEIGLASDAVEVLGVLPDYTTGTAFQISPVVALVQPDMQLHLNPEEVASSFEIPLHHFMNPGNHRKHAHEFAGIRREWFSMPYTDSTSGVERFVWGATAGILRNFYRFMSASA
jgi:8-oxo-dGTP pyrophosphatase MutT (NUDIX family)